MWFTVLIRPVRCSSMEAWAVLVVAVPWEAWAMAIRIVAKAIPMDQTPMRLVATVVWEEVLWFAECV